MAEKCWLFNGFSIFLWHRIQAALAPRMAATQALEGEVAAFGCAMRFQRLNGVHRTSRFKPTGGTQPGAEQQTVSLDHADEQLLHGASHAADDGMKTGRHAAARAKRCCSSARTAALSLSDVALMNSARSKPDRKRTTWAAGGS